ncbi:pyridoxamine 5'-phosphate oxidase [Citrobacter koseri]|nr:pyridoxamine 5'-phosphate oxidase [Citrobacter koseri]
MPDWRDPTAMVVATVDENGQPYQRIVLLKHYDEKGDGVLHQPGQP